MQYMSVKIKVSKTDPFRTGHTIYIGATNLPVCPVKSMKTYLSAKTGTQGPLFQYTSGKSLTRNDLIGETRHLLSSAGLVSSIYAGHSFRIGAATTAALAGLPPWLIKTLGRWSSDCYERYIQCPNSLITEVSSKLMSTKHT